MTIKKVSSPDFTWPGTDREENGLSYLEGEENVTIIIDADYTLQKEIRLGIRTTLIFEGGCIKGLSQGTSYKFKGNLTAIQAPPCQIFGEGIEVCGSWEIDHSYPQWFGAEPYKDIVACKNADSTNDRSSSVRAIQKAIDMFKGGNEEADAYSGGNRIGTVMIPDGVYLIDSPIFLPCGINILGIGYGNHATTVMEGGNHHYLRQGSIFYRSRTFINTGEGYGISFMVGVNINPADISQNLLSTPAPGSSIRYIQFDGYQNPNQDGSAIPAAIKIGCGFTVDSCSFSNLPIAVKTVRHYMDLKQVTNCQYNTGLYHLAEVAEGEMRDYPYAFDLRGSGDGLLFQHNMIAGTEEYGNKYENALALLDCGGALISDNVINSDIFISFSRGIAIANNHMEYGAQIRVHVSQVHIDSNYIEKYKRASLILKGTGYGDKTEIALTNNSFCSRSLRNHGIENKADEKYELYNAIESAITPVDIVMDGNVNLKVENSFRYWLQGPGIGSNHPMGLVINRSDFDGADFDDTEFGTSFDDFNFYSYILSYSSQISYGRVIGRNFKIENTRYPISLNFNVNSNILWRGGAGTFKYYSQIIWDMDRHIFGLPNGLNSTLVGSRLISQTQANSGCSGNLLRVQSSCNFLLRLIRKTTNNSTTVYHYVDIPVCGAIELFENGLSVNGFPWVQSSVNPTITLINDGVRIMQMVGDNVHCWSTSRNVSRFKVGDIVLSYNDPSWDIKLIQGSATSDDAQEI